MSREINEKIHICSDDGMFAMKTVANFIVNRMKNNKEIIFQSNFDFMQSDVPFAMHIKRLDNTGTPNVQITIIDAEWQLFTDHDSQFINGEYRTKYFEEWKSVIRDDDGTISALDAFYYWEDHATNINTNLIDLRDDIYEWMVKEYAFIIGEGLAKVFNCGGFIVYEASYNQKEE